MVFEEGYCFIKYDISPKYLDVISMVTLEQIMDAWDVPGTEIVEATVNMGSYLLIRYESLDVALKFNRLVSVRLEQLYATN